MAEEKKSAASLLPTANLLLVILGLAGSMLLLAGYLFSFGFYSSFKISPETTSLSLEQSLPQAFYLGLTIVLEAINLWKLFLLALLACIAFFLLFFGVVKYFVGVEKTKGYIDSLEGFHIKEPETSGSWYRYLNFIYIDFGKPAIKLFLALLGIVVFCALLSQAYTEGALTSQQQIAKFQAVENH